MKSRSFESGVLEQGDMLNMQWQGPPGAGRKNTGLDNKGSVVKIGERLVKILCFKLPLTFTVLKQMIFL